MKVYKNLTKEQAKEKGYSSNFSFASDSKDHTDLMSVREGRENKNKNSIIEYEFARFNKESNTVTIKILTPEEHLQFIKGTLVL